VANETTSKAVKSGFLKTSTSKSGPQGSTLISSGALLTNVSYFALSCLSTMAVNPEIQFKLQINIKMPNAQAFPFRSAAIRIDIGLQMMDETM
jgi:hypothetical protein